jgi:CheY-like chemotaxis protein
MTGRILFIDDDKAGREVALFNLRLAGYELTPAADGQEGLSLFSPEKFDLVITDAFLRIPRHVPTYRLEKYGIRRDS